MILGLTGYARVGKDTFAQALIDVAGFTRVGFADPLYEAVDAIDPLVTVDVVTGVGSEVAAFGCDVARVSALKAAGYDVSWLKEHTDYRDFLKALGNGMRAQDPDIWINLAHRKINQAIVRGLDVVISDVRFPNEADAIRGHDGQIIRIVREGYGPESDFELASDEIVADIEIGAPDVAGLQALVRPTLAYLDKVQKAYKALEAHR